MTPYRSDATLGLRSAPTVTAAIPTYNRAALLRVSLASVLAQDHPDFHVVVLDNASSDDTEQVVKSFNDRRVTYLRNEKNLGVEGNWNRAIEVNASPYLNVFNDDDLMLPGFLRESVKALDEHPSAAFSFSLAEFIGADGEPRGEGGNPQRVPDPKDTPPGLISGLDFLQLVVDERECGVLPSAVVFRTKALEAVKRFDSPHSKVTIDFNLYLRLLARFDVFFVSKTLVQWRVHGGQETENQFALARSMGWYGNLAERIDAIAYLLQSPRARTPEYCEWLGGRLLALHKNQSAAVHAAVPAGYHSWSDRRERVARDLEALIPPGSTYVLVDDDDLGIAPVDGCRAVPFFERDGISWGQPPDDASAVAAFDKVRRSAEFIIFAWVAFSWLNQYPTLHRRLRSECTCVLDNSNLIAFDLTMASGRQRLTGA